MNKKTTAKFKNIVTVPLKYYLSLLIFAILLGLISLIVSSEDVFHSALANLGYGVFCSTFVALLIDYGSTINKQIDDSKSFRILTKHIRNAINAIIRYRLTYEDLRRVQSDERKLEEWLFSMMFNADEKDAQFQEVGLSLFDALNQMVKMTKENLTAFGSNRYITEEFLNELDTLIINLIIIEDRKNFFKHDYSAISLIEAFSNVIKTITHLFPEYKSIFYEKWVKSEAIGFLKEIG